MNHGTRDRLQTSESVTFSAVHVAYPFLRSDLRGRVVGTFEERVGRMNASIDGVARRFEWFVERVQHESNATYGVRLGACARS